MNRKTSFGYDEVDNVKTVTNALGQETENQYDDLNRVQHTYFRPGVGGVSSGIQELHYTYTDAGDVKRVEEVFENRSLGRLTRFTEMTYDLRHRVTEEKRVNPLENNVARVVGYNYDKSDRVTKVTDATGRAVEYFFDAAGRLEKVKENSATQATYNYFANGLIEKATYANGSGVEYGYDGANRVETVKHLGANGATIQQYGYGFDKNGNRMRTVS